MDHLCKATAEDVDSLEETVVLQEFYFGKQNLGKFMECDNRFHQTMYKIAGRMLCYYTKGIRDHCKKIPCYILPGCSVSEGCA